MEKNTGARSNGPSPQHDIAPNVNKQWASYDGVTGRHGDRIGRHYLVWDQRRRSLAGLAEGRLTQRLRRAARARRRGGSPLELPHLVPEGGGEPVPSLVDDELLPLDGAAGGLVRLEEHVVHHLRHQLVLLLRDGG
jgi:hypothetical protein